MLLLPEKKNSEIECPIFLVPKIILQSNGVKFCPHSIAATATLPLCLTEFLSISGWEWKIQRSFWYFSYKNYKLEKDKYKCKFCLLITNWEFFNHLFSLISILTPSIYLDAWIISSYKIATMIIITSIKLFYIYWPTIDTNVVHYKDTKKTISTK